MLTQKYYHRFNGTINDDKLLVGTHFHELIYTKFCQQNQVKSIVFFEQVMLNNLMRQVNGLLLPGETEFH